MLEPRWVNRAKEGDPGGCDLELVEFRLAAHPGEELLRVGLAATRETLLPAQDDLISEALMRVRLLTKSRPEGEQSGALMAELFLEKLRVYPPDVVVEACNAWCDNEKFFPAWAELKEYLDRRVRKRKLILWALEHPK